MLMSLLDIENDYMEKYAKYSVEDFTTDKSFIHWVISPDSAADRYWDGIIREFPHQKETIEEAVILVKTFQVTEPSIPEERISRLKDRIDKKHQKSKGRKLNTLFRYAAILIALVSISIFIPRFYNTPNDVFNQTEIADGSEAQIIMSDGSKKTITKKNSEILVESSGQIIINSDTIKNTPSLQKEKLNQVIMPYGKQTSIHLPDGTKVYINAGSKISFPSVFSGAKREVFLVGEAYFEVVKNRAKPFIVHTADMNVTVTGTKFNVSAYAEDSFTETVLVSGAVNVSKQALLSKKIEIMPGECARYSKETSNIATEKVNTSFYTSWKNGYIICENDPLQDVVKKIERFYNKKISIEKSVENISFSGKLDLSGDIIEVLGSIVFASSLQLNNKVDQFVISR